MSETRELMLSRIRGFLQRGALPAERQAELAASLAAHRRNLVPARAAALDPAGQVALFVRMAAEADTTIARVASAADVPDAVQRYLAQHNLPARAVMTPDPALADISWEAAPLLELRRGLAEDGDAVGISACFAAIAETGTLMKLSAPETPTRNNFLPDTDIVVLRAAQVVGVYEDGWDALRRRAAMPRTVNFITGPSRTGDIAQKLELGAHGPRRLHIVLVDQDSDAGAPA